MVKNSNTSFSLPKKKKKKPTFNIGYQWLGRVEGVEDGERLLKRYRGAVE
jgi:hypothetical protein